MYIGESGVRWPTFYTPGARDSPVKLLCLFLDSNESLFFFLYLFCGPLYHENNILADRIMFSRQVLWPTYPTCGVSWQGRWGKLAHVILMGIFGDYYQRSCYDCQRSQSCWKTGQHCVDWRKKLSKWGGFWLSPWKSRMSLQEATEPVKSCLLIFYPVFGNGQPQFSSKLTGQSSAIIDWNPKVNVSRTMQIAFQLVFLFAGGYLWRGTS